MKFFMTLFLQLILTCLCLLCEALLQGKHVGSSMSPSGDCVKGGAGRTSKRVLAPEIPEETMRCTRLRAARQVSTTSEPDLSANQNQGDTSNSEQGKWLPTTIFFLSMCGMLHLYRVQSLLQHTLTFQNVFCSQSHCKCRSANCYRIEQY